MSNLDHMFAAESLQAPLPEAWALGGLWHALLCLGGCWKTTEKPQRCRRSASCCRHRMRKWSQNCRFLLNQAISYLLNLFLFFCFGTSATAAAQEYGEDVMMSKAFGGKMRKTGEGRDLDQLMDILLLEFLVATLSRFQILEIFIRIFILNFVSIYSSCNFRTGLAWCT